MRLHHTFVLPRRTPLRRASSIIALSCASMLGCRGDAGSAGYSCIAPANPGGGWDFSCRAIARALGATAPGGTLVDVINIPGDGGGVAFRRAVDKARARDQVIVAASPSTLLGLAQQHYGPHTERDVRWIAAVDAEPSIIAVGARSRWHTLAEFLAEWKAHPEAVTIGGTSAVGGQDHMKMLLLARASGLDVRRVRYRPVASPGEAIALVESDSIQVFPAELSKMLPQVRRGELRVLAVLGERRASGLLAGVPTAREQGINLAFVVWRGFYAPAGISDAAYAQWVTALRTMSASAEWKAELEKNGLAPYFLGGAEFERFVTDQTASYRTISKDIGILP